MDYLFKFLGSPDNLKSSPNLQILTLSCINNLIIHRFTHFDHYITIMKNQTNKKCLIQFINQLQNDQKPPIKFFQNISKKQQVPISIYMTILSRIIYSQFYFLDNFYDKDMLFTIQSEQTIDLIPPLYKAAMLQPDAFSKNENLVVSLTRFLDCRKVERTKRVKLLYDVGFIHYFTSQLYTDEIQTSYLQEILKVLLNSSSCKDDDNDLNITVLQTNNLINKLFQLLDDFQISTITQTAIMLISLIQNALLTEHPTFIKDILNNDLFNKVLMKYLNLPRSQIRLRQSTYACFSSLIQVINTDMIIQIFENEYYIEWMIELMMKDLYIISDDYQNIQYELLIIIQAILNAINVKNKDCVRFVEELVFNIQLIQNLESGSQSKGIQALCGDIIKLVGRLYEVSVVTQRCFVGEGGDDDEYERIDI